MLLYARRTGGHRCQSAIRLCRHMRPNSVHQDAVERAKALDAKLASCATLEERIGVIASHSSAALRSRQASASRIKPLRTPSRQAGKGIDIFTLDTGRHFPETLDTLFETEARYGIKIRVMFPDAAEVEELVSNDGIYGFRYSVDARKACCDIRKVRPLNRALERRFRVDYGAAPRTIAGPRNCTVCHFRSRTNAHQAQPDGRLDAGATGKLCCGEQNPRKCPARQGLSIDRLSALHARHCAG